MGATAYGTVRNLISPSKPTEKSYTEIVQALQQHYKPASSVTISRYRFNMRNREPGESVAVYVAQLRKLAEDCEFGASLNDNLRDRLVCGVKDDAIQRKLLTERNLTLDNAFTIATAQELAVRNVQILHGQQASSSSANTQAVNQIAKSSNAKSSMAKHSERKGGHSKSYRTNQEKPASGAASSYQQNTRGKTPKPNTSSNCYRCGENTHWANKCQHLHTRCSFCKKSWTFGESLLAKET
jgi:hypothetical protein